MKNLLFISLFICLIGNASCHDAHQTLQQRQELHKQQQPTLDEKAKKSEAFCKAKDMNTDFCLLINLGIHSGLKRFFIYDFKKGCVIDSGMVSHGCGSMPWGCSFSKNSPTCSNEADSHCSSLGKYKIGKRGISSWGIGINYLLLGLDSSNNNALKRQIVLHSWDKIPNEETYPSGIPEGWGCPATSDDFMRRLDFKLKSSSKPVLLWVYKSQTEHEN